MVERLNPNLKLVLMRGFYKPDLGELMRERPNLIATGLFYFVYVVGVVIFATAPALSGASGCAP